MKIVLLVVVLVLIVVIGVMASIFYFTKPNVPSSMVGTYIEQTTTGAGQSMQLQSGGTLLYQELYGNSTYISGTWKMLDDKTVEVSMQVLGTTMVGKFNVFDNDLVSEQNHNLWLKK